MASKFQKISKNTISSDKDDAIDIEQVYRDNFDRLYSYAKVICDSNELAKDVISDFFYGLLKNKTDLTKISNLEAYLSVGVKNLCIQKMMKVSKEEKTSILLATIDYIDPQQVLLGKELKSLLDRITNDLPEQCQLIFRMSRERGMTNQEISDELQIGTGTVKTQLIRAQTKFRNAIVSYYKDQNTNSTQWRLIGQFLFMVLGV